MSTKEKPDVTTHVVVIPSDTEPSSLSASEAAEYAKVGRSDIYKAFRAGHLKGKDFGGSRGIRTTKEHVNEWANAGFLTGGDDDNKA